jgi:hypothetical protein
MEPFAAPESAMEMDVPASVLICAVFAAMPMPPKTTDHACPVSAIPSAGASGRWNVSTSATSVG